MAYTTPKTDWTVSDGVVASDLNRIEENTRVVAQYGGPFGVTTGPANAYVVTASPPVTALVAGALVTVSINVTNTGASTITANGLAIKNILRHNGQAVGPGALVAGGVYTLRYNGTNFVLQGEGGVGTAQPSQVLAPQTFVNAGGEQVGTMIDRATDTAAAAHTPTSGRLYMRPPDGYYHGASVYVDDADFVSGNFSDTVNLFGMQGTGKIIFPDVGYTLARPLGDLLIAGHGAAMGHGSVKRSVAGAASPTNYFGAPQNGVTRFGGTGVELAFDNIWAQNTGLLSHGVHAAPAQDYLYTCDGRYLYRLDMGTLAVNRTSDILEGSSSHDCWDWHMSPDGTKVAIAGYTDGGTQLVGVADVATGAIIIRRLVPQTLSGVSGNFLAYKVVVTNNGTAYYVPRGYSGTAPFRYTIHRLTTDGTTTENWATMASTISSLEITTDNLHMLIGLDNGELRCMRISDQALIWTATPGTCTTFLQASRTQPWVCVTAQTTNVNTVSSDESTGLGYVLRTTDGGIVYQKNTRFAMSSSLEARQWVTRCGIHILTSATLKDSMLSMGYMSSDSLWHSEATFFKVQLQP